MKNVPLRDVCLTIFNKIVDLIIYTIVFEDEIGQCFETRSFCQLDVLKLDVC